MDVHQLRTLRELRDRGSVVAAAAALHLTPSAVSQQLAALQRSSAMPLTRRRGRELVLTRAGERLAVAAQDVIDAMERAQRVVDDTTDPSRRPITVTAFHSAALAWFPPLLQRGAACGAPVIRLRDEDVAVDEFAALTADHDLVIAHAPAGTRPWPAERVRVLPLINEPMALAVRRGSPLARRRRVRVADLVDLPWITVHQGFALEPLVAALAEAAHQPVSIAHRINEFHVAALMVAAGECVCLLPRHTGLPGYLAGEVALREIDDLHIERTICILTRPEALVRDQVRVVVDWIRDIAGVPPDDRGYPGLSSTICDTSR